LAVAEAVSGKQFSKYWLHGGHLFVEGKKMSKSKGNVYYPKDLYAKGFSGEQLRFFLIYGPYRQKLNFTFEKFAQTIQKLDSLRSMIMDLENTKSLSSARAQEDLEGKIIVDFEECMNNDLDVKSAFDSIYETISELNKKSQSLSEKELKNVINELHKVDGVLQCLF
jgi:cysteinyl-tRNA synthetase